MAEPTTKEYLDAVARALHPNKDMDDRFTYLPDQLPAMVTRLIQERDSYKEKYEGLQHAVNGLAQH